MDTGTGMGTGGAITGGAATTTVGTVATTTAGGITAIGGDLHVKTRPSQLSACFSSGGSPFLGHLKGDFRHLLRTS